MLPPTAQQVGRAPAPAQDFAANDAALTNIAATRRSPMLVSLFVALPATLLSDPAHAIDPTQTQVTLPDQMQWKPRSAGGPGGSMESAAVFGSIDQPGPYAILVRWHPGYMSAPHTYVTDRLCFVISGTWWVNSGENFEPENTVPVPAGGFVRRVAHTPHYDSVKRAARRSRRSLASSAKARSSSNLSIRPGRP
jgi:hypothetical protein